MWNDIETIRKQAPLVHNITNFVVMNSTANALLALGASPVMAHAPEEVEAMVGLAGALVINIGTLSLPWIEAMVLATRAARKRSLPIVLDPVGVGATPMRTEQARRLLREGPPTIVRGNASEILALVGAAGKTKGVDSTAAVETSVEAARELARQYGCVVSISGATDVIVSIDRLARVHNGHPIMTKVTGMGCAASALTGAFAAINPSPFAAAVNAMVVSGVVGELAAEKSAGPGSFQVNYLDAMHELDRATLEKRARVD